MFLFPILFCSACLQIFAAVLDPLNQAVQLSATQLSSHLDVAVYTLNCLSAINAVIILYQYTDTRLEMIKAQVGEKSCAILLRLILFLKVSGG